MLSQPAPHTLNFDLHHLRHLTLLASHKLTYLRYEPQFESLILTIEKTISSPVRVEMDMESISSVYSPPSINVIPISVNPL